VRWEFYVVHQIPDVKVIHGHYGIAYLNCAIPVSRSSFRQASNDGSLRSSLRTRVWASARPRGYRTNQEDTELGERDAWLYVSKEKVRVNACVPRIVIAGFFHPDSMLNGWWQFTRP
jgi:hypothetical protein